MGVLMGVPYQQFNPCPNEYTINKPICYLSDIKITRYYLLRNLKRSEGLYF
jgi:hypothetical protein